MIKGNVFIVDTRENSPGHLEEFKTETESRLNMTSRRDMAEGSLRGRGSSRGLLSTETIGKQQDQSTEKSHRRTAQ